jgi:hypothetical protein
MWRQAVGAASFFVDTCGKCEKSVEKEGICFLSSGMILTKKEASSH